MYSFRYGVEATHLGLLTHHYEERKGDLVRGSYSLLESDGRIRIVEYKVDGKKGFRAFVKYRRPPGNREPPVGIVIKYLCYTHCMASDFGIVSNEYLKENVIRLEFEWRIMPILQKTWKQNKNVIFRASGAYIDDASR